MAEEHIQFTGFSGDDDLFLSAELCETCPEFEEEACEVFFKFCFEGFFFVSFFESEEAEAVGILGDSLCKFALWGRSLSCPFGCVVVVICQSVAVPASGNGRCFQCDAPWNTGEDFRKINSTFLLVIAVEIFSRSLCEFPGFIAVKLTPLFHPR